MIMSNTNGSPFAFHANNVHSAGCGQPPSVEAGPNRHQPGRQRHR